MIISTLASPLVSYSMWLSNREHNASQQAGRKLLKPLWRSLPTTEHWEMPPRCQHKSQWKGLDIPPDLREDEKLIGLFSTFSISSFITSSKLQTFIWFSTWSSSVESIVHLWMIKAMVFHPLLSLNQSLMTSSSKKHSKAQMQIMFRKAGCINWP